MVIVKRVGILSMAKLQAIIMAIMGLILGIFYTVFASLISKTNSAAEPALAKFGWIGIILFPIIYGILGFVVGAIGAWLYNLIAKGVGGIEMEFEK